MWRKQVSLLNIYVTLDAYRITRGAYCKNVNVFFCHVLKKCAIIYIYKENVNQ